MANQPALEMQFQQLLDRESPADGLLSAPQLTQVQSIVQGSLNEAIEKATSAAAQAAVCAFSGSPPPSSSSGHLRRRIPCGYYTNFFNNIHKQ